MFTLPIKVCMDLASANMQYDIYNVVLSYFIIICWASTRADATH